MKPRLIVALLVFWPWLLIALQLLVIWWATSRGCVVSAQGPAPCMVMGMDIGAQISGMWTVGYQTAFSLMWVIPAILLWGITEIVRAFRKG